MEDDRRLFTEKEVSRILRRATEIQAESGAPEAYGLSLAELQQIAQEVGIEPQALVAAAAELEGREEEAFHMLGGPASVAVERVVAGELTEEKREAMLEEIRRTFHLTGAAGQVGRTLEWTYTGRREQAQVTVTAREGQIRIRVLQHFPKLAILSFVPVLAITLSLLPAFVAASGLAPLFALVLGLSFAFGVFLLARLVFSSVARSKQRKGEDLLHRLEQIAAGPGGALPLPDQQGVPEAEEPVRLDLELREEAPPDAGNPGGRRRARS